MTIRPGLLLCLVACATGGMSSLTMTGSRSLPRTRTCATCGAIALEVRGPSRATQAYGRVSVTCVGPDTSRVLRRSWPIGAPIDSVPAGTCEVGVQLIGYRAVWQKFELEAGRLLRLRAHLQPARIQTTPVVF